MTDQPDPTPPQSNVFESLVMTAAQMFAETVGMPAPAGFRLVANEIEGNKIISLLIAKPGGDLSHTVFTEDAFRNLIHQGQQILGEQPTGLVVAYGSSPFAQPNPGPNRAQRRHPNGSRG